MVGTRKSPRIHLDGAEEESFPVADHPNNPRGVDDKSQNSTSPQPAALEANRLRRLSFGGRGGTATNMLPALDRTKEKQAAGSSVPLPLERPKFHHGEPRPKRPKVRVCCLLCTATLVRAAKPQ